MSILTNIKSWKTGLASVVCFSFVGVVYFGYYFCYGSSCAVSGTSTFFKSNYDAYVAGKFFQNDFSDHELTKNYDIDIDHEDVLVFLHIQKTGGTTFGKHLVDNLKVDPPCTCIKPKNARKHCNCVTENNQVWLFSRYSTGWPCGLHADWTELTNCVDDWFQKRQGQKTRHYFYITLLRDPVNRFISEWMHVQRGATWKSALLKCNGRAATLEEVPFCFEEKDWKGVSLEEFMACKHNLAYNRQTRMLADLSSINCYNTTGMDARHRDHLMLASAKKNLLDMAFFGLVEFQTYTQFLFEHTLHMNFINDFVQANRTHSARLNIDEEMLSKIREMNWVDIELYQFAKDLFLQRVKQAYITDHRSVPEALQKLTTAQAAQKLKDSVSEGPSGQGTGVSVAQGKEELAVSGESSTTDTETRSRGKDDHNAVHNDNDQLSSKIVSKLMSKDGLVWTHR